MPAKILLIDGDAATIHWLQNKLAPEGYVIDTAQRGDLAMHKIEHNPPELIVLDLTLPDMDGLEIIRQVRANPRWSGISLIILSLRAQPDDILAGLNAGASHYVFKRPGADVELGAKIRATLAQPKKNTPSRGRVFSFCSAKGGTGTTAVCINTAYALAKLEPHAEIVVVDLVFPIGSVAPSLGYESRKTVAKLSQESGNPIDRVQVERYVSEPLKWGFHVLLGANDPQEAGALDVSHVLPIFETLRTMYDYILVDFGRTLSRISLPIIEISNAVAVIVTPDVNTVKASRVMIDYLESRDIDRKRIVLINNRTVGRVWTTTEDIERELKLSLRYTVPYVVEYMTMAINAAVPFMEKFPEHSACAVFRELAQFLRAYGKPHLI